MEKNVKIDETVHRQMSIRAAKLGIQKSVLTDALITIGLSMTDDAILKTIDSVTSHIKTEYPNQDQPDSQPK